MSFPTIFDQTRKLAAYRRSFQRYNTFVDSPKQSIEMLDGFLMRQIAAMYPSPPTILDFAALATVGESTALWAGEDSPAKAVIAAGVSWQTLQALDWSNLCSDILDGLPHDLSLIGEEADSVTTWQTIQKHLLFENPSILLVAHPDELESNQLQKSLSLWQSSLVFVLPIGETGSSKNLTSLLDYLSHAPDYRLSLLRELSPFAALSRLAVIYKAESSPVPDILERCRRVFSGNFDYLTLLEQHTRYQQQIINQNLNQSQPTASQATFASDKTASLNTQAVLSANLTGNNQENLPVSHRFYARVRPILKRSGFSSVLSMIFSKDRRAALAKRLGLTNFNQNQIREILPANKLSQVKMLQKRPSLKAKTGETDLSKGINFVGDLQAELGLSESARLLFKTLQKAQIPVSYHETIQMFASRQHSLELNLSTEENYPVTLIHVNPSEFASMLGELKSALFSKDKYVIAVWYWELLDFPRKWYWLFRYVDEVWVTSSYVQQIIAKVADVPVITIPLPIDVVYEEGISRQDFNLPENRFIFLFTFDPASSIARKNPFAVIEAFRRAFGSVKNDSRQPLLVLKTLEWEYAHTSTGLQALQDALQPVGGIMLNERLSRQKMNALTHLVDCFVSLHRCEGFGLGIAEAMKLQKPVIATGYSGNMSFMNNSTAYLVNYDLRPISVEDHEHQAIYVDVYEPGQLWAEPNLDHAAELMRQVYTNPVAAREQGKRAAEYLSKHHNYQVAADSVQKRLSVIAYHRQSSSDTP